MTSFTVIPPVITLLLESSQDVMVAADAARRLADLLGFYPASQAIASGMSQSLSDLLMRTQQSHVLQMNGIESDGRTGLQISTEVPWLHDKPAAVVLAGLKRRLGELADEVRFDADVIPVITLTIWLTAERSGVRVAARPLTHVGSPASL